MLYSIRLLDPMDAVTGTHDLRCSDDLDALAEGVRQSLTHAVEIWQATRLVARVKLGNTPLDAADARSL